MSSRFASLTEQVIEKIVEDNDTQNTKSRRRGLRSCWPIKWKRKKLSEPEENKELTQTLKTYILHSVFVISIIIKVSTPTLIILDITKTSSNNCLKFQQCNINLRSTNVRTILDTLCIKDYCELYLRIRINLLSHTCPGSLYLNHALG